MHYICALKKQNIFMNSYLILAIIAAYFALLLLIAWLTGRNNSNEAFFLGNRKSPWYIVSIGMVGTSLSGVTFVSVPGMVRAIDMTYMQTVFGFFFGYIVIAHVLLPLYYKLRLTSIYTYLDDRIGRRGYKTGASFFLLSKIVGAAARLYLVVLILQTYVFNAWHIPFALTAVISILLVWLYTFRSGIKTIIWTDTLQAICLVGMLVVIIWQVKGRMGLDFAGMAQTLVESPHFRIFEFSDWHNTQNFFKQFVSGIFITIVIKMPLTNCLKKFCVLCQSPNSKIRKWGLSTKVCAMPAKSNPIRSFTCQMITTNMPTRQMACNVSVQMMVLMPLRKV